MSVIIDIQNEIVYLIKFQTSLADNFEKRIKQYPTENEATHQLKAYRERALESIPHLKALLREVSEIQAHFSPKHLSPRVYAFYEDKLKEARTGLKKCKNDIGHLAKVFNIIAGVRNELPRAIAAAHAHQMQA